MKILRAPVWVLTLFLVASSAFGQTGSALMDRLRAFRFGGDRAVLDAVAQRVAESRPDPARRAEIARELAGVLTSDAAFDAKQFACRQFVYVAGEEQVPALGKLLQDEHLGHYALMALAKVPGKAANDFLIATLPSVSARMQVEVMDTLAARGESRAVPLLAERLGSSDPALADAAVSGLAKIGGANALSALQQAFARSSGDARHGIGQALLTLAYHDLEAGRADTAQKLYKLLDADTQDPRLRAAAVRLLVRSQGAKAVPQVLAALGEDGTPRQSAAAMLVRELHGPDVSRRLAEQLGRLNGPAQLLLLDALYDRGEPVATSTLLPLASSSQDEVRRAALRTLGAVGDEAAVRALLLAASRAGEDREIARAGLARLRGRGNAVDEALLGAVGRGEPATQVEAIRALGERRAQVAIPLLLREAKVNEASVSAAALRVLRDMGRTQDVPALLDILLAQPAGERDEVIETISSIVRRESDESQRAGLLIARLPAAAKPADKGDLLTILEQVGGPEALAAVRKAQSDPNAEVKSAALRILAEWPTDEPMADLLSTVRTAQDATQRAIALRGYLRMIGVNEQRTPDQALSLYRDAASLTRTADEKRLLLAGLAKIASLPALDFAAGFLKDESVRPEAEFAVVEIARTTAGADREKARAVLTPIATGSADENTRKRAADALAIIDKLGDYVTAWEVSPAYRREGIEFSRLFDMPFAPEEAANATSVPWRLMLAGTNPDQPWLLDLLALLGGDQRVAYLRTAVWSEAARDVVLELGSDDGVKAWLNGQIVLARNTARAVAPGQEKVKVSLKPGWNQLLLKITQNNQGWGAVARFANPDGSPATGLKFAVPSALSVRP